MITLLALVSTVLLLFELILIARVVLDWIGVLATPTGRAAAPINGVRTALHRVSVAVAVLAPVRRKLPALHLGGVSLDLSVTVVMIAVIVLRSVLP